MNNPVKTLPDGNQYEVLNLVSYSCPSCRMVTWHARQKKQEILCPFCWEGLPGYVTKVSAERMVASNKAQFTDSTWQRNRETEEEWGVSPFVLEFFMVQGAGFQCMAYRNGDGKWHEAFNNQELPGVVHLLE
jgi:hypothetical protein